MTKISKLLNHIREHHNNDELGLWFVLAFIDGRSAKGVETRTTDLVQKIEFGTGPTVHRKIQSLIKLGYIKIVKSKTDARAKKLSISQVGAKFMESIDQSITGALA